MSEEQKEEKKEEKKEEPVYWAVFEYGIVLKGDQRMVDEIMKQIGLEFIRLGGQVYDRKLLIGIFNNYGYVKQIDQEREAYKPINCCPCQKKEKKEKK